MYMYHSQIKDHNMEENKIEITKEEYEELQEYKENFIALQQLNRKKGKIWDKYQDMCNFIKFCEDRHNKVLRIWKSEWKSYKKIF